MVDKHELIQKLQCSLVYHIKIKPIYKSESIL